MPSLNGVELLQKVRYSGYLRTIPVIILSGDQNPEMKRQCLELGAFKYMLKPFKPDALLQEVDRGLDSKVGAGVLKTM